MALSEIAFALSSGPRDIFSMWNLVQSSKKEGLELLNIADYWDLFNIWRSHNVAILTSLLLNSCTLKWKTCTSLK